MCSSCNSTHKIYDIVGYGTFITQKYWKDKNVQLCQVLNHIRVLPEGNWFPFVLYQEGSSFWALLFSVNELELNHLDTYEGVDAGLYTRKKIEVLLKSKMKKNAFIYIPTKETIKKYDLAPQIDLNDRWKEKIKEYPEIVRSFPELVQ